MNQTMLRTAGATPFRQIVEGAVPVPASAIAIGTEPSQAALFDLREAPWQHVRIFGDSSGGSLTVEAHYWWEGMFKGALACTLTVTLGSTLATVHPTRGAGGAGAAGYEAELFALAAAGVAHPLVISQPGGPAHLFFPALDAHALSLRITGSDIQGLAAGKPCWSPPIIPEVPFIGRLTASAAAFTNEIFNDQAGTDLAVPGLGWEYLIRDVTIRTDTATAFSLKHGTNATDLVWGPFTPPVGIGQYVMERGVGNNKQPRLTSAGAFTGEVEIAGVKRPKQVA